MVANAQGVGHDRERRVDRATRWEKTAVHNIEVIEIVRLAVHIERRSLGIAAKSNRAILMGDACKWNALTYEHAACKKPRVAIVSVVRTLRLLLQYPFELGDQPLVAFFIIGLIGKSDTAVAVDGNLVVWVR